MHITMLRFLVIIEIENFSYSTRLSGFDNDRYIKKFEHNLTVQFQYILGGICFMT